MWMLVSGLALFFVAHLIPTFPDVRTRLVGMSGRGPYAGLFSLVSLVSLVLIVWVQCKASGELTHNCGYRLRG